MVDGVTGKVPGASAAPRPTASNQPARLEGGPAAAQDRAPARQAPRPIATTDTPVSTLVRDMAKQPPVDAARVAELKAGLASGSYRLDPDKTAAAMIRNEQISLGRR
jgi:negative regulator of flagellin synthesis FlgM